MITVLSFRVFPDGRRIHPFFVRGPGARSPPQPRSIAPLVVFCLPPTPSYRPLDLPVGLPSSPERRAPPFKRRAGRAATYFSTSTRSGISTSLFFLPGFPPRGDTLFRDGIGRAGDVLIPNLFLAPLELAPLPHRVDDFL